jgi:hypothetical protein
MISAAAVIRRIEMYFEGGALRRAEREIAPSWEPAHDYAL